MQLENAGWFPQIILQEPRVIPKQLEITADFAKKFKFFATLINKAKQVSQTKYCVCF